MSEYDSRTALVVVDVQNDFASPEGSLWVEGGSDVVPVINAEIADVLSAGGRVYYTQDWHPPVTPHFEKDGGIWPVHCVGGTWGAELHPELRVDGPVVRKGVGGEDGYSGFFVRDPESGETRPTELAGMLEAAGIRHVLVAGLATDYCVLATALDALTHGYPTTVLAEGIRAVELAPGDGDQALAELRAAGARIVGGATVEGEAD